MYMCIWLTRKPGCTAWGYYYRSRQDIVYSMSSDVATSEMEQADVDIESVDFQSHLPNSILKGEHYCLEKVKPYTEYTYMYAQEF